MKFSVAILLSSSFLSHALPPVLTRRERNATVQGREPNVAPPTLEPPRPVTPELLSPQDAHRFNRFTLKLFLEASKKKPHRSQIMSPVSAAMALGLTAGGARGETLDEFVAALGFGTSDGMQNATTGAQIPIDGGNDRVI